MVIGEMSNAGAAGVVVKTGYGCFQETAGQDADAVISIGNKHKI